MITDYEMFSKIIHSKKCVIFFLFLTTYRTYEFQSGGDVLKRDIGDCWFFLKFKDGFIYIYMYECFVCMYV